MSEAVSQPRPDWVEKRERGTVVLMQVTIRMATLLGRRAMRLLVIAIALWYRVFDRSTVRASRDWLRRVHGRTPGFWRVYRHFRAFVQVTLDRVFLITGRCADLEFTRTGNEHLQRQVDTGRGAVLLGAHLGSFDAMRASAVVEHLPIKILGYFKNARRINALLEALDPKQAVSVIHIGEDRVGAALRIQACIERGELIGVLGDRIGIGERTVPARFFGEQALFPAGPFLLASLLRCPIYLVFGVYTEPNRYDLVCEPFVDRLELPRADRDAALRECVQRYADRLEFHARRAPDNWFNFFDFWSAS